MKHPFNSCNIEINLLQHHYHTSATLKNFWVVAMTGKQQTATEGKIQIYFCNIRIKQLQHSYETCVTYTCNMQQTLPRRTAQVDGGGRRRGWQAGSSSSGDHSKELADGEIVLSEDLALVGSSRRRRNSDMAYL
ncbi:unnamed protein product [Urochloa humidicola]